MHTSIPIAPNRREEALDRVGELVECSRSGDGTVRYRTMEDITDWNVIRFFVQDEDAAAEAHTESAQYRRFVEGLTDLAAGQIETIQFETNDVQTVEFDAAEAVE